MSACACIKTRRLGHRPIACSADDLSQRLCELWLIDSAESSAGQPRYETTRESTLPVWSAARKASSAELKASEDPFRIAEYGVYAWHKSLHLHGSGDVLSLLGGAQCGAWFARTRKRETEGGEELASLSGKRKALRRFLEAFQLPVEPTPG